MMKIKTFLMISVFLFASISVVKPNQNLIDSLNNLSDALFDLEANLESKPQVSKQPLVSQDKPVNYFYLLSPVYVQGDVDKLGKEQFPKYFDVVEKLRNAIPSLEFKEVSSLDSAPKDNTLIVLSWAREERTKDEFEKIISKLNEFSNNNIISILYNFSANELKEIDPRTNSFEILDVKPNRNVTIFPLHGTYYRPDTALSRDKSNDEQMDKLINKLKLIHGI